MTVKNLLKKDDHSQDANRYALVDIKIFRLKSAIGFVRNKLWSIEDI